MLKTWKQLAAKIGVTEQTLSKWRRVNDDCPKEKDVEKWKEWLTKHKGEGKGSGRVKVDGKEYTAADIQDLKAKLLGAQERRENAMAQIRELDLQQRRDNLIPESEAKEALTKALNPLRKLLDAMPRQCAALCNPGEPGIAELAMRNYLDERVFAEMQKELKKG